MPEILAGDDREKATKKNQPDWVEPTLAKLTDDYFSDPDWIYERKLDGVRCLIFKDDKEVRLLSRNKKSKNNTYPEIVEALKKMNNSFVADGEIVTFEDNVTSFSSLQPRINKENPDQELIEKVPVYLYLFDLMHIGSYDITDLPLRKRKHLLKDAIDYDEVIHFCNHVNEKGEAFLEEACEKGWEGIIAK
ncbi:MAG: RNA ligase family protein, partial [Fulvivirga sp.]|nr:RNA ligase family protein [Fulvivirga sp.]